MDSADIKALMQELTSTAVDMSGDQLTDLHRACTIIEEITSFQCKQIISGCGVRPCLQIFMSDGWSTDIRTRFREPSHGLDVRRTGRLRTEFIVQLMIIKGVVNSEMQMAMKVERPRPLAAKKCIDIFSAACDHCPLLKLSGHRGFRFLFTCKTDCLQFPSEIGCMPGIISSSSIAPSSLLIHQTKTCVSCRIGF